MKQYRVLKEMPSVSVGDVRKADQNGDLNLVRGATRGGRAGQFYLAEEVPYLLEHGWIEEVQQPEYTEDDMIEFGHWIFGSSRKSGTSIKEELRKWKAGEDE